MTIATLDKVTLVGHRHNKDEVLAGLQDLGCLHLIPLTLEGKVAGDVGPSKHAREALHYLASATPRRRQATSSKRFDAAEVELQALRLQHRMFELRNRRDFISLRIDNLKPWGDFEFPTAEQLGGNRLWFYPVPHHLIGEVQNSGLRWEITAQDQRFYYVVVVSAEEPEDMPVPRLHTGGVSRHKLIEELEEVESELEDVDAERVSLTRWCTLFARALDGLEDGAARAQAAAQTAEAEPVYALQAWVPRNRMAELQAFAGTQTLALAVTQPEPTEQPPTLFQNAEPLRAGEDLVAFYMTPSYWLWDPSSVVFISFAVFFAMIVADAGYALLLAGIVLLYRKRLAASATGRRWRVMLSALAGATAVYGAMAGSYFGVTPPPDSPLGHLHVFDLDNFSVMMAVSVIIGASHIAYANFRDAWRYPRWPQRLPPLGWATAVLGGLAAWGGMQLTDQNLLYSGAGMMGVGLLLVVGFTGYGQKPLKRVVSGVIALTGVSGAFGDVLSYLRLFALGLASASLAMAFNDMAEDVRQALPGIGFLFGLLILVLGHGLNFLLSVASGFIHGLRLNVIEFFKWGVKDEGNPYRPFEKKETF
jgi:V/A-type H+/Na+-transporting ATPase subunit I